MTRRSVAAILVSLLAGLLPVGPAFADMYPPQPWPRDEVTAAFPKLFCYQETAIECQTGDVVECGPPDYAPWMRMELDLVAQRAAVLDHVNNEWSMVPKPFRFTSARRTHRDRGSIRFKLGESDLAVGFGGLSKPTEKISYRLVLSHSGGRYFMLLIGACERTPR
jgi:hypothetical protein